MALHNSPSPAQLHAVRMFYDSADFAGPGEWTRDMHTNLPGSDSLQVGFLVTGQCTQHLASTDKVGADAESDAMQDLQTLARADNIHREHCKSVLTFFVWEAALPIEIS